MWANVTKMVNGSPKEMADDLKEISYLSRKFLSRIDIYPNQYLPQVKVELQEARDLFLQILSRFLTLLSAHYEEDEEIKEAGFKLKFEEDVGAVIIYLRDEVPKVSENALGLSRLLRYAGELRTAWDFLVYSPITRSIKYSEKPEDFVKMVFVTARTSAGMLSKQVKVNITSKAITQTPMSMIKGGLDKGKDSDGEGDEGEGDNSDPPENIIAQETETHD